MNIQNTLMAVALYIEAYHAKAQMAVDVRKNRVILDISGKHEAFEDKQVWNDLAITLRMNPDIKGFIIRLNGKNMVEQPLPEVAEEREFIEDAKSYRPELVIDDGRFDPDRDYLPEDVGTDLKIRLEAAQSCEEFLKQIGVPV